MPAVPANVWITKYRYKVLEGALRERIRTIIRQVCKELVARFSQIDGYRYLSLIRASAEVNCQSALAWLTFRSSSQAAISSMRVCLSGIRRSRHWDERTPSSDSAISSQLPCFGV